MDMGDTAMLMEDMVIPTGDMDIHMEDMVRENQQKRRGKSSGRSYMQTGMTTRTIMRQTPPLYGSMR